MADVTNGGMHFTASLDTNQLNKAVEETLRRLQGLSDGTVAVGNAMDKATAEVVEQINIQKEVVFELEKSYTELSAQVQGMEPGTAQDTMREKAAAVKKELDEEKQGMVELVNQLQALSTANGIAANATGNIRDTLATIGTACAANEDALAKLEAEYSSLTQAMNKAFMSGNDAEYSAIKKRADALKAEIVTRQQVLSELREQSNELEVSAQKIEAERAAVENNANSHKSLRVQIRELKAEMAAYRMANGDQTEEYRQMSEKLGRLRDIQKDISAQGKILANEQAGFQGVMSGLQGVVGGFTAAQGAVALFAGENENLQKIMLKVQSLMSITMGLQQLSKTLDKDSAFMLVTVNGLKRIWNTLTGQSNAVLATNTAATATNTVATTAQATAAGAGTVANWSLAASFRAIGAAIKSIPVFGWIAAAIGAIIALVSSFSDEEDESTDALKKNKNALDENGESLSAVQRVYEGVMNEVSEEVGKVQFLNSVIHDNTLKNSERQKALAQLKAIIPGYNGLLDEEGRLTRDNTSAINEYIGALEKQALAKAAQKELEKLSTKEVEARLKEIRARNTLEQNTKNLTYGEKPKDANEAVTDATYHSQNARVVAEVRRDSRLAVEGAKKELSELKKEMEQIQRDKSDLMQLIKEEDLTGDILNGDGKKSNSSTGAKAGGTGAKASGTKETALQKLEKNLKAMKSAYSEYYKWVNSGDESVASAAKTEFADLLKQGNTYLDYLKAQRDQILSVDESKRSSTQKGYLHTLNTEIANETKATELEAFKSSLAEQLAGADSLIAKLDLIKEKRQELNESEGSADELDEAKMQELDEQEEKIREKQKERTQKLLEEYADYTTKRLQMEQEYVEDMLLLQAQLSDATTENEKKAIQAAIANRKAKYTEDTKGTGDEEYDELVEKYRTFEQKKSDIKAEYDAKRAKAESHGDTGLVEQLNIAEAKAQLENAFNALKGSSEYASAFGDLDAVSTDTLRKLIEKFEEVKESAAANLNPQDLQTYNDAITKMVDELGDRRPFGQLIKSYEQLKKANKEVKQAEKELADVQANGGKGTETEKKAIEKLNKAKDKQSKANSQVQKSSKKVSEQAKDLFDKFTELGDAIGGEVGQVVSMIGQVGSLTVGICDSFKSLSSGVSQSMSAMEKASVILGIITAALQIAQKIASMFASDGGKAEYEKAAEVYEDYISVLDEIIDKQLEMIETLDSENARNTYDYAVKLINKEAEAARTLGKEYLNMGATIGSSSRGVRQLKNMTAEAWDEVKGVMQDGVLSNAEYSELMSGRMTSFFNLTADQLAYLKAHAPVFWAHLHEETRGYAETIIEAGESAQEALETLQESYTGVDFSSLSDDFLDMLQDWDNSAKDMASNMGEYIRKALIKQMFLKQYQSQLQQWYDKFADALDPNGDGGTSITEEEQAALNTLRDSIVNGATAAAEKINEQFENPDAEESSSLSGSVQGVTEETADLVAGQMNAIRINQMEATEVFKQQLTTLNQIATNTAYNKHLAKLDRIVSLLEGSSTDKALRSQGLS